MHSLLSQFDFGQTYPWMSHYFTSRHVKLVEQEEFEAYENERILSSTLSHKKDGDH